MARRDNTEVAASDREESGGVPLVLFIVGLAVLNIAVLDGLLLSRRRAGPAATPG